ncbi:MAG: ATP synthase F1 subunit gamma [bacterium]|nr:ATP synthase F1 subunit gamma [bacterium]
MAKGTLTIRRQIKSITNTKKMTKAMELVSASKMRRAVSSVVATRPYGLAAREILAKLTPGSEGSRHPFLEKRAIKRVGIIVIGTNKGLCGGFNNVIAQKVMEVVRAERDAGAQGVELCTFGKRARDFLARYGETCFADFTKNDITTSVLDIVPLIHLMTERFLSGDIDKGYVVYMDYISSVRQKPVAQVLLPIDNKEGEHMGVEYVYEPTSEYVLEYVIPRLLESQVFQAVLESEASEHSSRMMAMHNASEAATDMLFDLRLTYNQIRQAGITQEIAEITSGRAALE